MYSNEQDLNWSSGAKKKKKRESSILRRYFQILTNTNFTNVTFSLAYLDSASKTHSNISTNEARIGTVVLQRGHA